MQADRVDQMTDCEFKSRAVSNHRFERIVCQKSDPDYFSISVVALHLLCETHCALTEKILTLVKHDLIRQGNTQCGANRRIN